MKRLYALSTAAIFVIAGACGGETAENGGEMGTGTDTTAQAGQTGQTGQAQGGALQTPEWFQVDNEAQTVTIDLTAGTTQDNNYWNFNGFYGGTGEIVVPQGYEVTINFDNQDPNMAHSVAVDSRTSNFPASFTNFQPAFDGAMTSGATQMQSATQPGESETITFTVDQAGDYSLVCLIPGHAAVGMWVKFTVSSGEEAGVRGGSA